MPSRILRANLGVGMLALAASAAALALGAPFMTTWFYSFAWWSCLLILDGFNVRRTGISPLFTGGRDFLFVAYISVPVWLIFELFNLRLRNWSYHAVPASLPVRWLGYAVAFATVIPAIKEFATLFAGVFRAALRFPPLRVTRNLLRASLGLGAVLLVLPLGWPRLFFPLVWLGFIFLLEPLNYRRRSVSFLRDLETGDGSRLLAWMAGGLAAGLTWELLNWWAGAHWEYHIPYFNFGRIFQMPVLGFGGFIPFALEVFALEAVLKSFDRNLRPRRFARFAFWVGLAVFDVGVFWLIDRFTVMP
jgi:hypothetical protein